MNPPNAQPTLPTLRDWTEPQTVAPGQLGAITTEATAAGYAVFRMDRHAAGYRLHFHRIGTPQRSAIVSHAERSQTPEQL